MKLLVILPHGNTASYLEQQRRNISELTKTRFFSFSPLYCPIAVAPEKELPKAEAKTLLAAVRDAVSKSGKDGNCIIDSITYMRHKGITALFCTAQLPFMEDVKDSLKTLGFEPVPQEMTGFCVGFTTNPAEKTKNGAESLIIESPHKMTVFRLGLMEFTPKAPFFCGTGETEDSAGNLTENHEPWAFEWKIISSVWKAKQKGA